jgi:hypothetical protein
MCCSLVGHPIAETIIDCSTICFLPYRPCFGVCFAYESILLPSIRRGPLRRLGW